MTAAPGDDLWRQVGDLLADRRSWNIEMSSSPGAPEVWAFAPGGDTELSVGVDRALIVGFVFDLDEEFRFETIGALAAWLDATEPLVLARSSMTADVFTRRLWDRIDGWRHRGG
jgi:hypothetical protein